MPKKEMSLRGKIIRELLADLTATNIGSKIKTGEFRKHPIEPEWKCPGDYDCVHIAMDGFTMEFLKRKENPGKKVILQLHGGGYIGPMKNVYRNFSVYYCERSGGHSVLTIDYRVAPEYPFPAALEDAVASYKWLLKEGYRGDEILLAGDSAGGGLAMCLCHYLKNENIPLPAGIIAMSAWTDLTCHGASYDDNYEIDPLFGNTRESMLYNGEYIGEHDPKDPYASPLFGDFTGFPPMLLQVGSHEMLLSDSLLTARKAKDAGVKVICSVYEGMFHAFQMTGMLIPESKKAWKQIEMFMKKIQFSQVVIKEDTR